MAHGLKPVFKTTVDEDSDVKVDSLVIDTSYLAHKHLHALRRFETEDGLPSGHVYGAFKQVKNLFFSLRPRKLVFTYDRRCTWRANIVSSYKQDRRPADGNNDAWSPSPDVERLFRGFPGTHLALDGAEADDMIAWYVLNNPAEQRRGSIAIISADRDLFQLVDDEQQVAICLVKKPKDKPKGKSQNYWIRSDEVAEEFGVPPTAVARIKALLGDPSDSIEGLTGGSRPGKKEALRKFATSGEGDVYFDAAQACPPCSTVPDWLTPELVSQRQRLLNNFEIADLRSASKRYSPVVETTKGSVGQTLGVLVEFECESLLAQAEPLFQAMSRLEV